MPARIATKKNAPVYVLRGKKIAFRTLVKEDVVIATPWFSDLEFLACLTSRGLPRSLANEEEWFADNLKISEKSVQFGICELKTGKYIGNCGLFNFSHHHSTAWMGIAIGDRSAWGKGYGTEASRLLAEYGFFFLNLYNIRLNVFAFNQRAIRAYLAAGYKEAGRFRGAICVAGKRYDEVVMDITRDDVDLSHMQALLPSLTLT